MVVRVAHTAAAHGEVLTEAITRVIHEASTLPREQLPAFLGGLETARMTARERLLSPPVATVQATDDRLIDIQEAAQRLGVSFHYLRRHEFPFTRHIGKRVLFSSEGIQKYIRQRRRR